MRRYLIALLMLAPLCALRAQDVVADSGVRIRITTVDGARAKNGTLISLTPDTLTYRPEFLLSVRRMPLDSIRAIERSRGVFRSPHSLLVGAGIGALVGVGLSAAVLAIPSNGDGPNSAVAVAYYGPLLIGAGVLAGGWIGSERRTEYWSPLYPDVADASIIAAPSGRNGFAFGFSVPYDIPLSIESPPSDSADQRADP